MTGPRSCCRNTSESLPERRGHGHGRALWRATMAWGARHGARYQLLQATAGGPSESLFCSEGLTTLGFTCAVAA
ncbi:GNAT family N-acetyltransferase [Amycolatopsis sp. NPDC051102]|uniref:GNAT family N-acetyltransferase n=1 Tax=Amycolatopsis sp. NPDC051102 TaxID=3155163 RepID=UPI0034156B04